MLVDTQLYEAELRSSQVISNSTDQECCDIGSGIESITCANSWSGQMVPREFQELSRAFRIKHLN